MDATPCVRPEYEGDGFYTKVITLRNGRKLYAAAYGLQAFYCRSRSKKPKRKD
ncbi:hypothetical protein [Azospirillum sp. BE72]|uniref:hypothetical protein n=1 Tax=Azospirillum sp. BE72 TaxID=2817776 RepID=UPI00285B526D|nr:hypothetical protein [Azospirillum sp. BE72]MDR6773574.1 hypothetical protein [Azospirillum sp. BE72]